MAGIVFDMSGNWMEIIQCDDIMGADRYSSMQLIYFGTVESLADPDGEMKFLKTASMIDRYEFFYDKPSFHVNEDPACATKYGLDPSKQNVLLFLSKDLKPAVLTGDPNDESVGPLDMM